MGAGIVGNAVSANIADAAVMEAPVATLTIRNLDEGTKSRLRQRAAKHDRSMEAKARAILQSAVSDEEEETAGGLATRIRARFPDLGGVDLEPLPRRPLREPPIFER